MNSKKSKGKLAPSVRLKMSAMAVRIISKLKEIGYAIDCWSVKGDGIATLDCDIAIDIRGPFKNDFDCTSIELVSYGNNLTRLKFVA